MSRSILLLTSAAVLILVCAIAWLRWQDPAAGRPLTGDEFHSVEYYTWVGLETSGEGRFLHRIGDLKAVPPPSLRQLGMGVYRSLGTWKEPNNHVLHSLLLNFSMLRGMPGERVIRIPAFIASMLFSGALYILLRFVFQWRFSAALGAVWAFCLPYVAYYGTEARGYTLTLLLQVVLLALIYIVASKPKSIAWGAAMVLTAVFTFMNSVNMAADWLLPVFAALWLFPPSTLATVNQDGDPGAVSDRGVTSEADGRTLWRRNLTVQCLALASVAALFLVDRLPWVITWSQQWATESSFSGLLDFFAKLRMIAWHLFPGPWWGLLGCCGLAGIALMFVSRENRALGILCTAPVIMTPLHFWLGKAIPPYRVCGHAIPLVLIGAAYLVQRICLRTRGVVRGACLLPFAALSIVFVYHARDIGRAAFDATSAWEEAADEIGGRGRTGVYVVTRPVDYELSKYLPPGWFCARDAITSDALLDRLVFMVSAKGPPILEMRRGASESPCKQALAVPELPNTDRTEEMALVSVPARIEPFSPASRFSGKGPNVVLWYPDPARVGTLGKRLRDWLQSSDVPFLRRSRRTPVEGGFSTHLFFSLEFVANSEQEWSKVCRAVEGGLRQFGGYAICFLAVSPAEEKPSSPAHQSTSTTRGSGQPGAR
jgi:hypothetical protein